MSSKISEKPTDYPFKVVATRVRPVNCSPEDVEDPAWYRDPEPRRDEQQAPEDLVATVPCCDRTQAASQFGALVYRFPAPDYRVKVLAGGAR